jgi:hypothetical protein
MIKFAGQKLTFAVFSHWQIQALSGPSGFRHDGLISTHCGPLTNWLTERFIALAVLQKFKLIAG